MKCPHCAKTMSAPHAVETYLPPAIRATILTCPYCDAVLGAVNKPKD